MMRYVFHRIPVELKLDCLTFFVLNQADTRLRMTLSHYVFFVPFQIVYVFRANPFYNR